MRQARQPVRFADAARAILTEGNLNAIVDLGPQNVIAHLLKDSAGMVGSRTVEVLSVCDRPTTNTLAPLVQSLASLFMLGVTPDFEHLYSGRRIVPSKVAIPTYPWQRQRHYPSIIPSRTTKIKGLEGTVVYSRTWHIGNELGPLLKDDHTVDGVPIVPAAALAMFISLEARKACSSVVSVDIKYLKPLLLEIPDRDDLVIDIEGDKVTCTHFRDSKNMGVICSGSLKVVNGSLGKPSSRSLPDETIDKVETYGKFSNNLVRFGPSFQCIQTIDRFERASARIEASPSGSAEHDFVRKMDAILHMFGAIAPETPDELRNTGSFLPSAVNGLTLYATSLPEKLTCEYRLPIKVAAGSKKMTAEFKVFSELGELLATCNEYIVSWLPSKNSIPRTKDSKADSAASTKLSAPKPQQAPHPRPTENLSIESIQKAVAGSLKTILGLTEADMKNIGELILVLFPYILKFKLYKQMPPHLYFPSASTRYRSPSSDPMWWRSTTSTYPCLSSGRKASLFLNTRNSSSRT